MKALARLFGEAQFLVAGVLVEPGYGLLRRNHCCLLYTSDAADERSSVDLGGRRIIKKKNILEHDVWLEVAMHDVQENHT